MERPANYQAQLGLLRVLAPHIAGDPATMSDQQRRAYATRFGVSVNDLFSDTDQGARLRAILKAGGVKL